MKDDSESLDSTPPEPPDELLGLLFDMSEGGIDGDGAARLNAMLQDAAANRATYIRFMQLVAGLEWDHVDSSSSNSPNDAAAGLLDSLTADRCILMPSQADGASAIVLRETSRSHGSEVRRKWNPLRNPLAASLCASLATLAAVFSFGQWRDSRLADHATPPVAAAPSDQLTRLPVAFLASANGDSWGKDSPRLQKLGSPVNVGDEVTLQEGIAEFRLSNGVYVSIEGPAGLVLNSPNSAVLQYGKMTSHVPNSAGDFKVLAGASRLTACGAEFGVHLSGGEVGIHVFSGEVLAVNSTFMDDGTGAKEIVRWNQPQRDVEVAEPTGLLTEAVVRHNRSVVIRGEADAVNIAGWGNSDDAKFATRLPMSAPLPIDSDYVDAVLDSRPVGYWRFESAVDKVVRNEVERGGDVRVFGDVELLGDAGNHVVEMGRSESDGFFAAAAATDAMSHTDYSVELWMRPSHVHAAAIVTLAGEDSATQDERPGFYLGLHGSGNAPSSGAFNGLHPGAVRFLNRDPPSGDFLTGTSCYSGSSYQLRRWQHVVAVKEQQEMRLYLNGELAATAEDDRFLASDLRLIVGEASTSERTYRFHGQLDELAIYDRAVTERDIRAHFRAVHWASGGMKGRTKQKDLSTIY